MCAFHLLCACDWSMTDHCGYSSSSSSSSSSSIYWTGPFPGVKTPIEVCALGGMYALLKQLM